MRSPWTYFAAALALSLTAAPGTHAAEPGVSGRAAKACKADSDSFCAGVKPGEGGKAAAKAALAERKAAK